MPTTPYAKILVSVNGGGNTSGGLTVPSAATIVLSPESTVGWGPSPKWEIYGFPSGYTAPAGWSTDGTGVIFYTGVTPPGFTLPAAATRWGKWMLRLTVNGNIIDEATALSMLSPLKSLRDIGIREGAQFGGALGQWIAELQADLRIIEAIAAGSTSVTGTGLWHSVSGALDAAASLGTTKQIYVVNAGGTDGAWVTVSGDATLSAAGVVAVTGLTGAAGVVAVTPGTKLAWATGNAVLEVTAASTKLSVTFAGTERFKVDSAHGAVYAGNGGTDYCASMGPLTGNETSNAALWLLPNATAQTSGNCVIYSDGTATWINGKSATGTIRFSFGGSNSIMSLMAASSIIGMAWPLGGLNNLSASSFQWQTGTPSFPSDANYTMVAGEFSCPILKVTSVGSLTATRNLVAPLTVGSFYMVFNNTTGAQAIQIIGASGTGITIANGKRALVYSDGTNYQRLTPDT